MKCPIDDSPLSVSSRDGVEIDFCPQCRGVWLDRGELDKIIDRASVAIAGAPAPAAQPYSAPVSDPRDDRRYDDRRHDDRDDYRRDPKRKRRSFLDDMFDFG
ncbi:MAG: zf-TFIIB domain-containing protein [Acidimicrobiales bacterium]|nr:zf-TFIIB domain-containing protein [Acidimicrobiales bacterium]